MHSKGGLVKLRKGQDQPRPCLQHLRDLPCLLSVYEDLVLLSKFFQVVVETVKSRLISVELWDQKGKDFLISESKTPGKKRWLSWGHVMLFYREILEGCA